MPRPRADSAPVDVAARRRRDLAITGGLGNYCVVACNPWRFSSPNSNAISLSDSSRPDEMQAAGQPVAGHQEALMGGVDIDAGRKRCRHFTNAQCVVAAWPPRGRRVPAAVPPRRPSTPRSLQPRPGEDSGSTVRRDFHHDLKRARIASPAPRGCRASAFRRNSPAPRSGRRSWR